VDKPLYSSLQLLLRYLMSSIWGPILSEPERATGGDPRPATNHKSDTSQKKGPYSTMSTVPKLRIGLFGIGLAAYWPQFDGLEARLNSYVQTVADRLAARANTIVNFGLVDSPERAMLVSHQTRQEDIDLLVLYVTTYALSSTVLPIVRRAKVPLLVLNLQPTAGLDYETFNALPDRTAMTGEWLAYCSACAMPELANVFMRSGIPFYQVNGILGASPTDDPQCWQEIQDWMDAAHVAHTLSHTRLGLMGHYYSGMLDIPTDLTTVASVFGTHIEALEIDELTTLRQAVPHEALPAKLEAFQQAFDIQPDCPADELDRAARTSIALDQFVAAHDLGALAYFYKGTPGSPNEDTIASIILGSSMLTARGISTAGEYETKNVLAMKILDTFKAGGSFTEYYAVDFSDDIVLMGHDGPGHIAIAESKTKVRPLEVFHGKVGRGLSVEMSIKRGPVTLLSVVECNKNGFKLLIGQGQVEPGPILQIGNTNSRFRFAIGARKFLEQWNAQAPAHHCAIGLGHLAPKLQKLAHLLDIDLVQIC
jgi:L-arabinose isomerase